MLTEIIWIAAVSSVLTLLLGWFFVYIIVYLKRKYVGQSYTKKLKYRGLLADLKAERKET